MVRAGAAGGDERVTHWPVEEKIHDPIPVDVAELLPSQVVLRAAVAVGRLADARPARHRVPDRHHRPESPPREEEAVKQEQRVEDLRQERDPLQRRQAGRKEMEQLHRPPPGIPAKASGRAVVWEVWGVWAVWEVSDGPGLPILPILPASRSASRFRWPMTLAC